MLNIPSGVRPALRFLPPARRPWLLPISPPIIWFYVRFGNRVIREELHDIERLISAYQQLQDGKARLIVAFRHPGVEDGTVVFRLMSGIVGREARRRGMKLRRPPRGYFLFGRDVPEWAGQYLNWLLPRIGAISVFPGRFDSQSIATMRRYLTEMPHPIALAPEGQVTYHNERVAALENGTAQLAFWCMEDLKKQARTEDVLIVPVNTSYHYSLRSWKGLLKLLDKTEKECGFPPPEGLTPRGRIHAVRFFEDREAREKVYIRVMRISRHLMRLAEEHYGRFYGISFPAPQEEENDEVLQERMRAVCDAALGVAERYLRLTPKGDFVQRVFAARQAVLMWMHREDISDVASLPPIERALADRVAVETWMCNRHVELVDVLEYLRADYLTPDSGFDRFVETITNLWDVVNRLQGGNVGGRINPFFKTARIVVDEPISVSRYWDLYKENRRKAVRALTGEIFESLRAVAENDNQPAR
jgi:hypothetical protein